MMADQFRMNGDIWSVEFVPYNHPKLVDRTGILRVATTDPDGYVVRLSNQLGGDVLMTVFLHELGHCAMCSYGMLDEIHRMVLPRYWIRMEEFICNFLADFGMKIFRIAYQVLGHDAWKLIPYEFDKKFA